MPLTVESRPHFTQLPAGPEPPRHPSPSLALLVHRARPEPLLSWPLCSWPAMVSPLGPEGRRPRVYGAAGAEWPRHEHGCPGGSVPAAAWAPTNPAGGPRAQPRPTGTVRSPAGPHWRACRSDRRPGFPVVRLTCRHLRQGACPRPPPEMLPPGWLPSSAFLAFLPPPAEAGRDLDLPQSYCHCTPQPCRCTSRYGIAADRRAVHPVRTPSSRHRAGWPAWRPDHRPAPERSRFRCSQPLLRRRTRDAVG